MIKRVFESKGGYLHQFCVYRIKERALRRGFLLMGVEVMSRDGHAKDLVLRKDNDVFIIEVSMSYPMDKEISNVLKDIASDLDPKQVIVAVKDTRMKKTLESLIAGTEALKMHLGKIRIVYAGDLIAGKGKEV